MVEPALLLLFFVLTGFFAVAAGAYFGLDRVSRARLEHESEGDGGGMVDVLRNPRTLRAALDLLGDACRVGFVVTGYELADDLYIDLGLSPGAALWATIGTIFILIFGFGELAPRVLAARHAEAVTRFLSGPLQLLLAVTSPLRRLSGRMLPRPGASPRDVEAALETPGGIDEEEFRELVDESTQAGVVGAQEQALIHKILDFGDRRVREVMTPFDRIFSVAEDEPVALVARKVAEGKYSRIPVHRKDIRKIVGVVYAKDLLPIRWDVASPKPLKLLLRRPLYVVPQMRAQALLESFKRHRLHLAVVVDEQGLAVGLCTMEDLLEELVGPITDVAAERKGEEANPRP